MTAKTKENIRVLIADDHMMFRIGIEAILQKIPVIKYIDHAENGDDVLRMLSKKKFDIVFMDILMPVADGIETTKRISAQFPDIPVIALTSVDDRDKIVRMIDAGARGYLLKNADLEQVKNAIEKVLTGSHYYADEVEKNLFSKLLHQSPVEQKQSLDEISERLRAVLFLICHEFTSREIADRIAASEKTVEGYRAKLLEITASKNLAGLVMFAIKNKIPEDDQLMRKYKVTPKQF